MYGRGVKVRYRASGSAWGVSSDWPMHKQLTYRLGNTRLNFPQSARCARYDGDLCAIGAESCSRAGTKVQLRRIRSDTRSGNVSPARHVWWFESSAEICPFWGVRRFTETGRSSSGATDAVKSLDASPRSGSSADAAHPPMKSSTRIEEDPPWS